MNELSLPGNPENVVLRFAPNPNGPGTLGHARVILINWLLVQKHNGKFILRFDDTDPKTKKPLPEAYEWYLEDSKWLGVEYDQVVECSSHIDHYYEVAQKLIELGKAYFCECSQETFKRAKDTGKACPHHEKTIEENLEGWQKMLSGEMSEGSAVLRIKTDLSNPDPALRDWAAFRIVKDEHPKVGTKYTVWPLLDFAGAIEDHDLGVTHIIRGKELTDSGKRQQYMYNYLGWAYPEVVYIGRIKVEEESVKTKLSTSKIAKAIEDGEYTGWSDVQLHTMLALRRRGITPEAIKNLTLSLGLTSNDVSVSMENLYAENRKVLDDNTNRYFFVEDPVEVTLLRTPLKTVRLALHPGHKERGFREQVLEVNEKGESIIQVSSKDAENLKEEGQAKLMGLPCIQVEQGEGLRTACLVEKVKARKMQWIQKGVPCKILMYDRAASEPVEGLCETACSSLEVGEIVQFERFGFCRLDSKDDETLVFTYSHK